MPRYQRGCVRHSAPAFRALCCVTSNACVQARTSPSGASLDRTSPLASPPETSPQRGSPRHSRARSRRTSSSAGSTRSLPARRRVAQAARGCRCCRICFSPIGKCRASQTPCRTITSRWPTYRRRSIARLQAGLRGRVSSCSRTGVRVGEGRAGRLFQLACPLYPPHPARHACATLCFCCRRQHASAAMHPWRPRKGRSCWPRGHLHWYGDLQLPRQLLPV